MNKMSFEELFRKHLQSYAEEPRAEVWTHISRRLEGRRRRRRMAWWLSSAAFVAGLTAFTLWLRHEPAQKPLSQVSEFADGSFTQAGSQPTFTAPNENSLKENHTSSTSSPGPQTDNPAVSGTSGRTSSGASRFGRKSRAATASTLNGTNRPAPSAAGLTEQNELIINEAFSEASASDAISAPAEGKKPETSDQTLATAQNNQEAESDLHQDTRQENEKRCLPFFMGLSYEAGSLWRLSPVSATPGTWLPSEAVETLPGIKSAKATSFSDILQSVQFTAGYRFSDVLSLHISLGHTRINHFESGNLLNRTLPAEGQLGVMTGTGAFRVGSEAVSEGEISLRKLSQHFSFITVAPGVTYNLNLKQWVVGFNAAAQLHILAGNRADATFAHTVRSYRHEGLRSLNGSLNAGVSVGYRFQRFVAAIGFQGGYWIAPLSRPGFVGSRYIQAGIRPSLVYHF